MRGLPVRALAVCVAVAAVVGLGDGRHPPPPGINATPTAASGVLSHSNSRDGLSVLTAGGLTPGDSASGTVTIQNTGALAGAFELVQTPPQDTPGPAGGLLSSRLALRVRDLTTPTQPTVYNGTLGAFTPRALGTLVENEERTYGFTVTLPDGGTPPGPNTGDNAFRASALSVGYEWRAERADTDTPPAPGPGSPPTVPGGRVPSRAADRSAPWLAVRVPARQRLRGRRLIAYVRCSEACSVSLKARLRARGGGATLKLRGRRGIELPAERRRRVALDLRGRAIKLIRSQLRHRRQVTVLLSFRVRDSSGNARSFKKRAHLRGR